MTSIAVTKSKALVRERKRPRRRYVKIPDTALAPVGDRVLGEVNAVRVPAEVGEPVDVEPHRAADVQT
jgi:hypothetical protein